MDFIDLSAEPSGEFKYILLVQDIFSRKLRATAFKDKSMSSVVADLRALFADHENPKNLTQMVNLTTKPINGFLGKNSIAVRHKEGWQDLAAPDAAMHNFKKMLKKMMQQQNTTNWKKTVAKSYQSSQRYDARGVDGQCGSKRGL